VRIENDDGIETRNFMELEDMKVSSFGDFNESLVKFVPTPIEIISSFNLQTMFPLSCARAHARTRSCPLAQLKIGCPA